MVILLVVMVVTRLWRMGHGGNRTHARTHAPQEEMQCASSMATSASWRRAWRPRMTSRKARESSRSGVTYSSLTWGAGLARSSVMRRLIEASFWELEGEIE